MAACVASQRLPASPSRPIRISPLEMGQINTAYVEAMRRFVDARPYGPRLAAQTTLDWEGMRRNHRALVGRQVQHSLRDLFGRCVTSKRHERIKGLRGLVTRLTRGPH